MIIIALFALWVALIFGIAMRQQSLIARSQRQGLLRAASQFGGRLEGFSWFELPRIHLWKRNFEASIQFIGSGNLGLKTQFRIPWPDRELECEVRRRPVVERLTSFLHQQPIELAAPLLDDSYIVTGNDESQVRRLFSARAQTALINLLTLPVPNSLDLPDVQFSIADGLFTITKSGRITDSYYLESFIRWCAELHDAALAAVGSSNAIAAGSENKSCA